LTRIYVFPGQGSQHKGMGMDLFERYPDLVRQAETQLGYSLATLCLEDPHDRLTQTEFLQPALYVVSALTYLQKCETEKTAPDYVAGHSLGEYAALFAAGCFDFLTGVKLVQMRGLLMSKVSGKGMAAVIGLPPVKIREVLQSSSKGTIDIANYNSYNQTVIAGPVEDIAGVKSALESAGARAVIPLNVSAPFHSRYMRDAQRQLETFLAGFSFSDPKIPVISNYRALPYEAGRARETLAEQVANPVRWLETVLYLLRLPDPAFEEIGPGTVLARLIAQIQKEQGSHE